MTMRRLLPACHSCLSVLTISKLFMAICILASPSASALTCLPRHPQIEVVAVATKRRLPWHVRPLSRQSAFASGSNPPCCRRGVFANFEPVSVAQRISKLILLAANCNIALTLAIDRQDSKPFLLLHCERHCCQVVEATGKPSPLVHLRTLHSNRPVMITNETHT